MSEDTIIGFKTPEAERTDPFTDLLRAGRSGCLPLLGKDAKGLSARTIGYLKDC